MNESGKNFARLNDHIVRVSENERLRRRRRSFLGLSSVVLLALTSWIILVNSSRSPMRVSNTQDQNNPVANTSLSSLENFIGDTTSFMMYPQRWNDSSTSSLKEEPIGYLAHTDTATRIETYAPESLHQSVNNPNAVPDNKTETAATDTRVSASSSAIEPPQELQPDEILPSIQINKEPQVPSTTTEVVKDTLGNFPKWEQNVQNGILRGAGRNGSIMEQPRLDVDVEPYFPGGRAALSRFIKENIEYPENARKQRLEGTVFVRFIVETDGSISQPVILKGLGQDCDEQALKLVSNMPRWQPGMKNGDVVPTYKELGIMFKMY